MANRKAQCFLVTLLLLALCCADSKLLGDFSLFMPKRAKLVSTPFSGLTLRGTRVDGGDDGSIEETHQFDVIVPNVDTYKKLLSSGSGELLKLMMQRLQAESVSGGKGSSYKLWLSSDHCLISLKMFPLGYRTFLLRHNSDEDAAVSIEDSGIVCSVIDLDQGLASKACALSIKIKLSEIGLKCSLHCRSKHIEKSLKKRLLQALRDAWSDRLRDDLALVTARLLQMREHKVSSNTAEKERRKQANEKVINPLKPISPTVRRPGSGGRVALGSSRKAKQQTKVVRRGG